MAAKKKPAPRAPRARPEPTKRCARCVRYGREPERPLSEFPRNRATADGLAVYCRQCKREADRERLRAPPASPQPGGEEHEHHPAPPNVGDVQSSASRLRAPALAITDELIEKSSGIIREIGATRRAAARHVGVSENTFKGWLREAADLKDQNDPRARLLFAIEMAEGEAELAATRAYWAGTKLDPQVAQRFLERRFSKGDEKWARTEHLEVTDGDRAPMETADARKLLADKLGKLIASRGASGAAGPPALSPAADGAVVAEGTSSSADAGGVAPAPDGAS
jgi:hypothetical protein